jgi:ferrochelatase
MREVASHYDVFGGVSPINAHNRALIAALRAELDARGPALPVYWGNRHWVPFLKDTLAEMTAAGVRRALAFVTSAFSSASGCRQYLDAIASARAGLGGAAPEIEKLRGFYNHPGFIVAVSERVREALVAIPEARRAFAPIVFTAHSLPVVMAACSDYEAEIREACGLIMDRIGSRPFSLAYQSGPPGAPWLGPDIGEHLRTLRASGVRDAVVAPLGFLSDHMEVVYDLDVAARATAEEIGLGMVRAGTVGTHPALIGMIRDLILERTDGAVRQALGARGPRPDVCAPDCCRPKTGYERAS